jgi:hypothetical protein
MSVSKDLLLELVVSELDARLRHLLLDAHTLTGLRQLRVDPLRGPLLLGSHPLMVVRNHHTDPPVGPILHPVGASVAL